MDTYEVDQLFSSVRLESKTRNRGDSMDVSPAELLLPLAEIHHARAPLDFLASEGL